MSRVSARFADRPVQLQSRRANAFRASRPPRHGIPVRRRPFARARRADPSLRHPPHRGRRRRASTAAWTTPPGTPSPGRATSSSANRPTARRPRSRRSSRSSTTTRRSTSPSALFDDPARVTQPPRPPRLVPGRLDRGEHRQPRRRAHRLLLHAQPVGHARRRVHQRGRQQLGRQLGPGLGGRHGRSTPRAGRPRRASRSASCASTPPRAGPGACRSTAATSGPASARPGRRSPATPAAGSASSATCAASRTSRRAAALEILPYAGRAARALRRRGRATPSATAPTTASPPASTPSSAWATTSPST